MLAQWPRRDGYPRSDETPGDAARMLDLLTRLADTELIERFLAEVTAAGVYGKGDNAAIVAAIGSLTAAAGSGLG